MTGTLIAIGGAVSLDGECMQTAYSLFGGADANIVIFPTASSLPDAGEGIKQAFIQMGVKRQPQILPIRSRAEPVESANLSSIREASGIFFTGGNQLRITAAINGTIYHQVLMEAYQKGTHVAGTSAGAAVLSQLMIAYGKSSPTPRQGIAQFLMGIGFTDKIIFDQHFKQRDRLGRLIYAVCSNPGLLGVGIDEDTAAIFDGTLLKVVGRGAITVVDGTEIDQSNITELEGNQPVAVTNLRVHVLTRGCQFSLLNRTATLSISTLVVE